MTAKHRFLRLATILGYVVWVASSQNATDESKVENDRRLRSFLLLEKKYDTGVRPMSGPNETTQVRFSLGLLDVPVLNPKKHLFYVDAYTCMTWTDPRLKWDAEKFGGLNMVRLRASEIWVPKVVVMAFVDLSPRSDSVALASPGGGVAYCPVHPVHAACKTDMTHFPFDRHECIVEFTNFIDTESNVNLTAGDNPAAPEGRSEFKVVSITTTRRVQNYGGDFTYPFIVYNFVLERSSSLHLYTVVLPTAGAGLVSLLVFWLPPASDRKFTLIGASILVSLLLLYRVADVAEGSFKAPKIVIVLGTMVLSNAFIAVCTVVSMHMVKSVQRRRLPAVLAKVSRVVATGVPFLCPVPGQVGTPGLSGRRKDSDEDQEKTTYDDAALREWYIAAQALDRVLFLVFATTYVLVCV
nr:putative histamine-gated chloride channel, his-5 [Ixodes ricinus]